MSMMSSNLAALQAMLGAGATGGAGIGAGGAVAGAAGFPWLTAGGIGLSALGGVLGAQSTNRAARQARDYQAARTGEGAARYGQSLWGAGNYGDLISGSQGNGAAADRFTSSIGGPISMQLSDLAKYGDTQSGAIRSGYASDTGRLSGLAGGTLADLGRAYKGGTDALMGSYDQGAANIMRMADQFGKGRSAIIDQDAAKTQRNLDDATLAQLAATGFGNSTVAGDMLRGNAKSVAENTNRAKQDLGDSQIGLTTNLARSMQSERSGQNLSMVKAWLDAQERGGNTQVDREYSRSSGQTQLDSAGLDRVLNLKMMPINTNLSALSGNVMNPYLGSNTSQFYPGVSAGGTALTNVGNAGAQMGSLLWLKQLMGTNN